MEITGLKNFFDSFGAAEVNIKVILIILGVFFLAAFVLWMFMRPKTWGKQQLSHRKEWMIQQKKP